MREQMIRVLHVFGRTGRGGAESRIMDLYRRIDRDRIQFDFLVHADPRPAGSSSPASESLMAVREADDFDEEILSLGGRIYALPRMGFARGLAGPIAYRKACERFFDTHMNTWRVVQGHMTSTAAFYLAAAKRSGVPVTVAHARSAGTDPGLKGFLTKTMRRPLTDPGFLVRDGNGRKVPAIDHCFACSHEAAKAVFGERPVTVLPNAIDVEEFRYSEEKREKIRRELGLGDGFAIGHVGTFRYAKNHEFLLHVFRRYLEEGRDRNSILLLIGNGDLMPDVKKQAEELGIADRLIFTGLRTDVADCYQAMDAFAFPSRYEGLPGSVVEAQTAGLPCLISDRITRDVDVTDRIFRMSIGKEHDPGATEEAEKSWARKLREIRGTVGETPRETISERARRE
ncbi:MAG: glycosyltransferase, partial [Lachnospiraceae bacterium]|nr:glycosyltransferase [Lachnospiraceae bacterium]